MRKPLQYGLWQPQLIVNQGDVPGLQLPCKYSHQEVVDTRFTTGRLEFRLMYYMLLSGTNGNHGQVRRTNVLTSSQLKLVAKRVSQRLTPQRKDLDYLSCVSPWFLLQRGSFSLLMFYRELSNSVSIYAPAPR